MKVLVVGGSGATGTHLVDRLLALGHQVRAVVRSKTALTATWQDHPQVELVEATLLDMSDPELQALTQDCGAIASCLGHRLSFKGMYGKPRRLVTDAVRRLCQAAMVHNPKNPIKFVLMNTLGNRNRDLAEKRTLGEHLVIGLLRLLLPPHVDNEQAADWLRTQIGQGHNQIQWVAVRPDNLINADTVSSYELFASPTRSPLFNAGQTSRINVGDCMARLIHEDVLWQQWQGQMPVVYNS
ncbi:NAD(P)-dependent oxidoreductase [Sediminicola luteus]|uniref:NAD-dependent epimerase n=1 Tax=Sediminicola luteus TaxID=319238 RepID=A0A2A4G576_9FLAO|nr:NAD(P)-binding oxidoreductase [Sediminicola luteus]PCE62892.1 NAD-dependent epimerase [Sediminicola luteus]